MYVQTFSEPHTPFPLKFHFLIYKLTAGSVLLKYLAGSERLMNALDENHLAQRASDNL